MVIRRGYRYELDPNVNQRILLAKHVGCARFAYNWGLARRRYVSLCCEVQIEDPTPVKGEVVGIDLGLTSFLAMSDGTKIGAPKPLEKKIRRLKRLSKQHSRREKGSRNRKKSATEIARLHRSIRNSRIDFIHKLTTTLAKTKSEIVIEDLNVRGMVRNHRLARYISDVGFREFRRQLEYKTKWYGSVLTVVGRYYPSSKTCSDCGHVVEDMLLSVREWDCPGCGVHHDRDTNAARNLRQQASTARARTA